MLTLGQALRARRKVLGHTQTDASKLIGIEQSYLSKLETDNAWASDDVLETICKRYRIRPRELLQEVNQESLRGNDQYQGLVFRSSQRQRLYRHLAVSVGLAIAFVGALWVAAYDGSTAARPQHERLSAELRDIDGVVALSMIGDWGGLTFQGLDQVDGTIEYLKFEDRPWDEALAITAGSLGYIVVLKGREVTLQPKGAI